MMVVESTDKKPEKLDEEQKDHMLLPERDEKNNDVFVTFDKM